MSDVLIAAYGSRGDIMPLTDVALSLTAAGHRVTMTTNTDLVDELTDFGIFARPVDFSLDDRSDPERDDPMKLAMQMVKPAGMRQLGRNILAAIEDVLADVALLARSPSSPATRSPSPATSPPQACGCNPSQLPATSHPHCWAPGRPDH